MLSSTCIIQRPFLFRDWNTFSLIMQETQPKEHKKLGRRVTPFREDDWKAVSRRVVTRGCWLKFSQNPDLLEELLATGDSMFVECAPRDQLWGIGLGQNNPRATDPTKWRGKNWPGENITVTKLHLR